MPKKRAVQVVVEEAAVVEPAVREHDGLPIVSVPSPWWTVLGMVDEDHWSAVFFASTESQAINFRNVAFKQWEQDEYSKYDDFAVLPPETRHEKASGRNALEHGYLVSILPAHEPQRTTARLAARSNEAATTTRRRTNPRAVAV